MDQVALRALKAYPYAGLSLTPGDEFVASEKDANLLKMIGHAEDAPAKRGYAAKVIQPPVPDASQDAAPPSPPRSRRRYKRRDLEAQG